MIAVFALLALVAEIIGTIGGFGSSLFFVPLAQFFFDMKLVLGITAIFHVFSNASKLVMFRKFIDWKLTFRFGIPSIIFVILGASLTNIISFRFDQIVLGAFLISFSTLLLMNDTLKLKPTNTTGIAGGSIAGFLAGFIGTGGAVRGLALSAFQLEKNLFVGTSAAIDMGVDFSRSIIYTHNGYVTKSSYPILAVLFFVSIIGSYIGKVSLEKIEQSSFRKIVLWLILMVGIVVTAKSVYSFVK